MIKLARSLVLPLALVVAVTACDKGKKGAGGGGGATGAAGASAIAPAQGGLRRALAAMPADTDIILGLDASQLRKSDLWKQYGPKVMAKATKDLEAFKAKCGFDPIEKFTGAIVGIKARDGGSADVVAFVRGFDKKSVGDCLPKMQAEAQAKGETKKYTLDGDYVEMDDGNGETARFKFIDDQTALLIVKDGASADRAALDAAAAAKDGDGLTSSKTFVSLLDSTKTGSAMWFLVNGSMQQLAQGMSQLPGGMKVVAIFGSGNVSSGVDAVVNMRMDSKDNANTLKTLLEVGMKQAEGMPNGAELLKGIKLSTSNADVVMTMKYDQKTLEKLTQMAQMMGGM